MPAAVQLNEFAIIHPSRRVSSEGGRESVFSVSKFLVQGFSSVAKGTMRSEPLKNENSFY